MADVLAVRDEYRAQTWAMLIQECSNSEESPRKASTTGSRYCAAIWRKPLGLSWFGWILFLLQMTYSRSNTGEQN